MYVTSTPLIRWLDQIDENKHRSEVGGKAVNLAKLILAEVNCPPGFCVTTRAFDLFMDISTNKNIIIGLLRDSTISSNQCSSEITNLLSEVPVPIEIQTKVVDAYSQMIQQYGVETSFAVRSSAVVEDSKEHSFAGQFDTFLGVKTEEDLFDNIRNCWISLFSARSIAYSRRKKIGVLPLAMGVIVQKLVKALKAGVMFTIHPVEHNNDVIVIEAVFGLGEQLVSGRVSPDTYIVSKCDQKIIKKNIKNIIDIGTEGSNDLSLNGNHISRLDSRHPSAHVLSDQEICELSKTGNAIELLFGEPQDIEWAIDMSNFYIVQSRPVTVHPTSFYPQKES